ncbi:MAG: hypothetical protein HYV07_01780 [Deltaproteobacteria bacterium]|nr:hypothetical protein [Deltaproteobacteria bacterium]
MSSRPCAWLSTRTARLVVVAAILALNALAFEYLDDSALPFPTQSRKDASGFSFERARKFHYFHYHLGYFPLASLNADLVDSREGAEHELAARGHDLVMEHEHWSRLGESARIWAFLPNAWLHRSTESPSIRPFNALCFLAGVLALYLGLFRAGRAVLGLALVSVIHSTPYFWREVYGRENIFGLAGSALFLAVGLVAPFAIGGARGFRERSDSWPERWARSLRPGAAAALVGLLVGLFAEVRNEVAAVIAAPLFLLVTAPRPARERLVVAAVTLGAFLGCRAAIRAHFEHEWARTSALVGSLGGHVYTGARIPGHRLWHAVFCGLGDFGADRGYAWDDRVAYAHAVPKLRDGLGMKLVYTGGYHLEQYYDDAKLYYVKFDELDEYEAVMKQEVLTVVSKNPGWFVSILARRVVAMLTTTAPFPGAGWLLPPLLVVSLLRRRFREVRLLVASLALSAPTLLIYSGSGATYGSVFPIFALACLAAWPFEGGGTKAPSPELRVTVPWRDRR